MGDEHLILLHHDRDHFLGEMFGIVQMMINFAHKGSHYVSQSPRCPVPDGLGDFQVTCSIKL